MPTVNMLKDIEVDEISLVDRPANKRRFLLLKQEDSDTGEDAGGTDLQQIREIVSELLEAVVNVSLPPEVAEVVEKLAEAVGLEQVEGHVEQAAAEKRAEQGLLSRLKSLIFQYEKKESLKKDEVEDKEHEDEHNEDTMEDGESIEKEGRKISTARLERLRRLHESLVETAQALSELIDEAAPGEDERGEFEVTREELEKAVGDIISEKFGEMSVSLDSLKQKVAELEKVDEKIQKQVEEMIREAVDPLVGRLETVEKARNVSQSLSDEAGEQKNDGGVFKGVIFGR